jgi:transcriptional regulator with XRE-family HTH domain
MSSPGPSDPAADRRAVGRILRRARIARGWSQPRLVREMQHVAHDLGLTVPTSGSLRTSISRWEGGHRVPDEFNRRLLCVALGLEIADLGLPYDPDYDAAWP